MKQRTRGAREKIGERQAKGAFFADVRTSCTKGGQAMNFKLAIIIAFGLALVLSIVGAALAHDHANHSLDSWYPTLSSPTGGRCCDGPEVDAMKIEDADWGMTGDPENPYRVRLEGNWVLVPIGRVVSENNKAGVAIVWPIYEQGKPAARCFLPGSGA